MRSQKQLQILRLQPLQRPPLRMTGSLFFQFEKEGTHTC